jgi:hypothetical protein
MERLDCKPFPRVGKKLRISKSCCVIIFFKCDGEKVVISESNHKPLTGFC